MGAAPAEAQRGGGKEAGGQGAAPHSASVAAARAVFPTMKRPCEETTSESDMDETIDVGSENNYSG